MAREIGEETALILPEAAFTYAETFSDGRTFRIHVFAARAELTKARALTEEPIAAHACDRLNALPLGEHTLTYLEAARMALLHRESEEAHAGRRVKP